MANEPILGLALEASGDTSWYSSYEEVREVLGLINAPDHVFFVSPAFNTTDIPSLASSTDRRHFDTIQDAIDAAAAKYSSSILMPIVKIEPGTYDETITLSENIALVSAGAWLPFSPYGQGGVWIRGANSASPTITINTIDSQYCRYAFMGLGLDNKYSGSGASPSEYLMKVEPQTTLGGGQNTIDMIGCSCRMQPWGSGNHWTNGIHVEGHHRLRVIQCAIAGYNNGDTGNITNLIRLTGTLGGAQSAYLMAYLTRFAAYPKTSYSSRVVNGLYSIGGYAARCDFNQALSDIYQTSGTVDYVNGLQSPSAFESMRNTEGVDLCMM